LREISSGKEIEELGKMLKMMRTIGLAAAVLLVASQAQAVSSINLIWGGVGSSTVTVSSSVNTTLLGNIVVTADAAGITAIGISFEWDNDLRDELNWTGMGKETPGVKCGSGCLFNPVIQGYTEVYVESALGSNGGVVGTFDQVTTNVTGLVSKTRTMGTIVFSTNALNVVDDGIDVQIVVLNNGIDGIVDSNSNIISGIVSLGGGTVNSGVVPEPTTALLMVAGVLGLGLAGRRVARK
jgi:hypothetical protein